MIKRITLISAIVLATWFQLSADTNKPFINPTPGEISIMAVNPFPEGVNPSFEGYSAITDCGFNLVTAMNSVEYFKKQFDLMGDLNLKYIISNPGLRNDNRQQFIRGLQHNKHFGGWLFIDEPQFDALNDLSLQYNALYKASPNQFIYMNLVGQMVKKFVGNYRDYSAYLQDIQRKFQPMIWSFDVYPIYKEGGKISVMYDQFFTDLEAMKDISQETQRPFWSFCLGMSYKVGNREFPAASEPYLRFAAFSALAYGAQGIVYWTYGLRKSTSTEKYLSALVDLDGKKTSAWYAAQTVNSEIKKFNEIFYECNVKYVKHTGKKSYKGTTKLNGSFGPFKSIKNGDSGVLVSHLEKNGKYYFVIVNHDIINPQSIKLLLLENRGVRNLTSVDLKEYKNGEDISLKIDRGSYLIFEVVK